MKKFYSALASVLLFCFFSNRSFSQISLTSTGTYTQNFNSLATSGTANPWSNNSTIPGWFLYRQPAPGTDITTYDASTGSSTTGTFFSYGTDGDRALGGLGSGGSYFGSPSSGNIAGWIAVAFTNNTGGTINDITVAFNGEQWRNGGNASAQTMVLEYGFGSSFASVTSWTAPSGNFDWASPVATTTAGAVDGNNAGRVSNRGGALSSVNWTNGTTLWIRWVERNDAGNDHGLAIDDFSLTTGGSVADVTPPTISSLTPANGATNVLNTSTATINFSEAVQKGTGNIVVKKTSDNSVVQTLDVTSPAVTISSSSASFTFSNLSINTDYYIEIDNGAFQDLSSNNFAGISGSSTWSFRTSSAIFYAGFSNCTGGLSDNFNQFSVSGAQTWGCTTFGVDAVHSATGSAANGVQINGFASGANVPNNDWLISPALDLSSTTYPLLSFYSRVAFNGAPLQLKVSTDYPGNGDPTGYTWTDLNGKFPNQGSDVWTLSNNINLSAYKSTHTYIAFVYTSTNEDGARWTLDDIQVDNSATPPPPSITLSPTDIQFGFTASGNTSDKSFVVTGNDITGDITLTASSNFTLSTTSGGTFTPSVTLTQATANNVPTTVYVRFSPDQNGKNYTGTVKIQTASVADTTISLNGSSIDPATTLEVVNWNMEWFGTPDPSLGPSNKAQQEANAATILQNIHADIFGLVEVVDTAALGNIVRTNLPGYSYIICNYGSHGNPYESNPSPMNELQKEAFVYKTNMFSNIDTSSLVSDGVNTAADLANPAYNYFSSGRYPFMMKADVTLNGVTKTIGFVLLHAKANTSPTATAYARRKSGADTLYYTLNKLYPNDNILILGDFNDDLDQTITAGITPPTTSYSAFTSDNTNFYSPTLQLSQEGKKSTVSYNDMIDHVILSNEMAPYYMANSAEVLSDVTSLVSNYSSTTSDHYPVFTRYAFTAAGPLPVKLLSFNAAKDRSQVKLTWSTTEEVNTKEFVVERSSDGHNYASIGRVVANGNTNSVSNYSFNDQAPNTGVNFYRLKMVDVDAKSSYSKIAKIDFSKPYTIVISPNPAKSYFNVTVTNISEPMTLEITDVSGRVLQSQNISSQNNTISVSSLGKGLYFVKLRNTTTSYTEKLVIE